MTSRVKSRERLATRSRQRSALLDIYRALYSEKLRAFGQGFRKHVEDLSKKANQKPHAFARLCTYIDPVKSEILMNSFIKS